MSSNKKRKEIIMLKFFSLLLMMNLFISLPASAEETFPSFANVPWGASEKIVSQYMINSELEYIGTDSDGDLHFKGTMYDAPIEVIEILDSKNHTLVKSYVVVGNKSFNAKSLYKKIDLALSLIYGKPCEVDKSGVSYWATSDGTNIFGSSISLRITNGTVYIVYESSKWPAEANYRQKHSNML